MRYLLYTQKMSFTGLSYQPVVWPNSTKEGVKFVISTVVNKLLNEGFCFYLFILLALLQLPLTVYIIDYNGKLQQENVLLKMCVQISKIFYKEWFAELRGCLAVAVTLYVKG